MFLVVGVEGEGGVGGEGRRGSSSPTTLLILSCKFEVHCALGWKRPAGRIDQCEQRSYVISFGSVVAVAYIISLHVTERHRVQCHSLSADEWTATLSPRMMYMIEVVQCSQRRRLPVHKGHASSFYPPARARVCVSVCVCARGRGEG